MDIEQAVETVVKYVQKGGTATIVAVRSLWSRDSFGFSEPLILLLAQEALAARANAAMTNGRFTVKSPEKPMRDFSISYSPQPKREPIYVSVDIRPLLDTWYDVNGKRKALIEFTAFDISVIRSDFRAQVDGISRRDRVLEYAEERLKTLGKKSISELAQGEKDILGRKWKAAVEGDRNAAAA